MSFQYAFVLPSTHCPEPCAHCFYETGHSQRIADQDYLEPLNGALEDLTDRGLVQVIISGGEPLASPRLRPLVRLCNTRTVHLLLLTRGHLLTEQTLELLEEDGVDDISLSALRADDALQQTVNRILFRSRYIPTLLTCVSRENACEVPGLLELSSRLNLTQIFTPAYIPPDSPAHGSLSLHCLDPGERARLFETLAPWAEQAGALPYLALVQAFYEGQPVHPGHCDMGTSGLVVDADGSVYPCFHRHDLRAGNLLSDPWPDIREALERMSPMLGEAPCFGEHCLSMFVGIRGFDTTRVA